MRWIPLLLFICANVFGFANVNVTAPVDARPQVATDGIGHVEKGAVTIDATGTISGDVRPGAVTATIEKGAFNASTCAPLIESPITANISPDAVNVKPGAVSITTQPKTVNIEIDSGAIVIHAEGVTDAALKPMQELKQGLLGAGAEAKTYLWYLVVGLTGMCVVLIGVALAVHFIHVRHAAALAGIRNA